MRCLIFICFIFKVFFLYAKDSSTRLDDVNVNDNINGHECLASVRSEKNQKIITKRVKLQIDTKKVNSFENRFLAIHHATNKAPIALNTKDKNLQHRACTAFYHASIARDFFLQHFQKDLSEHLNSIRTRQLIIRIEMDQGFHPSTHFMHKNRGLYFNNALTIPPSSSRRLTDHPWYYEVWFAPKKVLNVKGSIERASEIVTSQNFMLSLLKGIIQTQTTTIIANEINQLPYDAQYYAMSLAFSIGVTTLIPYTIRLSTKIFPKKVFLDSGLIPEVIYHEFAHFALAPHLPIDRHSPLAEAVANFMASEIGNTHAILNKTRGLSKGLRKMSAKGIMKYDYTYESQSYAQLSFGFKLLYALNKRITSETFYPLLLDTLKDLRQYSIKNDFSTMFYQKVLKQRPDLWPHVLNTYQEYGL